MKITKKKQKCHICGRELLGNEQVMKHYKNVHGRNYPSEERNIDIFGVKFVRPKRNQIRDLPSKTKELLKQTK